MAVEKDELHAQITYRLVEGLSHSEKRYETLVENLQEVVFESDLKGTFKFLNSTWENTLGYTTKESLGCRLCDFVFEEDKKLCLQLFDFGKKRRHKSKQNTLRFLHKKGHLLWLVVSVMADDKGNVSGSLHDITELRETTVSKDYVDSIVGSMIDALVVITPEGEIERVNKETCGLLGYKEEELIGKDVSLLFPEEQVPLKRAKLEKLIGKDEFGNYDINCKAKDGRIIPLLLSVAALKRVDCSHKGPTKNCLVYKEKGKHCERILVICVARDITERKQAEEALRESEEKYRKLFEETTDAIFVANAETGIITDCNRAASELTGREKSELVGKHQRILHPPEAVEVGFSKSYKQHFGEKESQVLEERVITKKGEIKDVAIEASCFELKGEKRIQGMFRDITERKKAEEALRESEERYRSLTDGVLDTSEVGIFILDKNFRILWVNRALESYFGLRREEILGKDKRQLIREHVKYIFEDSESFAEKVLATYDNNTYIENFMCHVLPEGERKERWLEHWSQPVQSGLYSGGRIEHYTDVTERKKAEQKLQALNRDLIATAKKLEESNRQLQDFVYIASHDLREPLRKITSFGGLLQDSLGGSLAKDDQENLDFMIDGAKRMTQMIEGLVAYSRINTQEIPFEVVDLNEIVEQLQQLELAEALEETSGTIEVPQPLPKVQSNPIQIRQLLQNLVGNAIRYRREQVRPQIVIRAKQIDNDKVRIEVQDNGIGIEPEYHNDIFTMFRRLHSRRKYGGTGIGLAVCKKIVERHNGQIGVESRCGEGSTFWFTLSVANEVIAVDEVVGAM